MTFDIFILIAPVLLVILPTSVILTPFRHETEYSIYATPSFLVLLSNFPKKKFVPVIFLAVVGGVCVCVSGDSRPVQGETCATHRGECRAHTFSVYFSGQL